MEERKRRLAKALKDQLEKIKQEGKLHGVGGGILRKSKSFIDFKNDSLQSSLEAKSGSKDLEGGEPEVPLHVRSFLLKTSPFRLPVKDQIERLIKNIETARDKRKQEFSKYKSQTATNVNS